MIPPACYMKLSDTKWYSWSKIVALIVMVFGILIMVIGTVLTILEVRTYVYNDISM